MDESARVAVQCNGVLGSAVMQWAVDGSTVGLWVCQSAAASLIVDR